MITVPGGIAKKYTDGSLELFIERTCVHGVPYVFPLEFVDKNYVVHVTRSRMLNASDFAYASVDRNSSTKSEVMIYFNDVDSANPGGSGKSFYISVFGRWRN